MFDIIFEPRHLETITDANMCLKASSLKIHVKGFNDNMVILKELDNSKYKHKYFLGQNGENKFCDYIILDLTNKKGAILECTTDRHSQTDTINKFRASQCLLYYFFDIMANFHEFDKNNFELRFYSIQGVGNTRKNRSNFNYQKGNDPHNYQILPANNIEYNLNLWLNGKK